MKTVKLLNVPVTLTQMKTLPESKLDSPEGVAALAIASLRIYSAGVAEGLSMINFLKGPTPLTFTEMRSLKAVSEELKYAPNSLFSSAKLENNYMLEAPYELTIVDEKEEVEDGITYKTFYFKSSGCEDPKPVTVWKKRFSGQWFFKWHDIATGVTRPKLLPVIMTTDMGE